MGVVAELIAIGIAVFACGDRLRAAAGIPVAAALLALLIGLHGADAAVPLLIATAGPFLAGRAVRSRRALVRALAERTRELEREEEAHVQLAVRGERARVARDLHDIVAHHLVVVVVQAGAGRTDPAGAPARFAAIRAAAADVLADLARLTDAAHGPENLAAVLDRARLAGLQVTAGPLAPIDTLAPELRAVAHRVVQEGLTNAIKHAPGAVVRIAAAWEGEVLEVAVRDDGGRDGATTPLGATGAGAGLRGLRERLDAVGGSLAAGAAQDGGWAVVARLPVGGAAPSREGAMATSPG